MTGWVAWAKAREVMTIVLAIAALGLAAHTMASCASMRATGAWAGYTAAHLRCIDRADTRSESRACRQAVRAAWDTDAGR